MAQVHLVTRVESSINRIKRLRNNPESTDVPTIRDNKKILINDLDKAIGFGEHFSSMFALDKTLPTTDFHRSITSGLADFAYTSAAPEFFTLKDINFAIKSINNKNTIDTQGVSNSMLKHLPLAFKNFF